MRSELEDKLQERFLEVCRARLGGVEIPDNLARAFRAVPRAQFIQRYRLRGGAAWHTVTPENVVEHLPAIYQDQPLTLTGPEDAAVTSTISMPSFVLRMLQLLDLRPGHRAFEIGTGSGFAAAVMGKAVEPGGAVYTSEIITDLAHQAKAALARAGVDNVTVIDRDGGEGYPERAPYDRIVYTAGAYDLPRAHFEQLKDGGLMLFVLKNRIGGDATLLLLEKRGGHLASRAAVPCGFVGFTGKYAEEGLNPVPLGALPGFGPIADAVVSRRPFGWSGSGDANARAMLGVLHAYLDLAYPTQFVPLTETTAVDTYGDNSFFGFWSSDRSGISIARKGAVVTHGDAKAERELFGAVHAWIDAGMPALYDLALKVCPSDRDVPPGPPATWVCRRPESTFYWYRTA
jgi:protein-L-isoaspartate(D-aspartate) O-methyltransferase